MRLRANKIENLISATYRFIRDLYHDHIHHSGDQPLWVIRARDEGEAVEKILMQYRQKVKEYHKQAKDLIKTKNFNQAIDTLFSAMGEMQYASSFITLFFDGKRKAFLLSVFKNGISHSDIGLAICEIKL
ncbi:MAG: hypothetical protein N2557_07860 [Hydrogenophilus sp.]|nr:hypothetical protein [Hydrogenophilus sp.]